MDKSAASKVGKAKHEKFRNLAERRTNRALEAIIRIGNLSNRQLYEYEDAEVRKIVKALKDAVSEVENRFASPKGKRDGRFKL
jgi:hypothetical protein